MSVTVHWLFPAAENDRSLLLCNYGVAFAGCNSIQQRLRRKKENFHCCISHFAKCLSENSWPTASLLLESSLKHHTGITHLVKLLKTQLAHCMALEEKMRQGWYKKLGKVWKW